VSVEQNYGKDDKEAILPF